MNTKGLIPMADLPCLLRRDADYLQSWFDLGVLTAVVVDGATYAPRAQVERLRDDPLAAVTAELDALEAAGLPITHPENMATALRALDLTTPWVRGS